MKKNHAVAFLSAVSLLTVSLVPIVSAQNSGTSIRIRACVQTYLTGRFSLPREQRRQRHVQLHMCIRAAIAGSSSSSVSSSLSSSLSSSSVSSSSSSLSSVSSSSVSSSSSSVSSTLSGSVVIQNMAYTPKNLTVKKGTTVKWTNMSNAIHTVTRNGATGPQSPYLVPGQNYSYTFSNTGSYLYHCLVHPNMTGSVLVTQ